MSDLPTFDVVAASIRELGLQFIGVLPLESFRLLQQTTICARMSCEGAEHVETTFSCARHRGRQFNRPRSRNSGDQVLRLARRLERTSRRRPFGRRRSQFRIRSDRRQCREMFPPIRILRMRSICHRRASGTQLFKLRRTTTMNMRTNPRAPARCIARSRAASRSPAACSCCLRWPIMARPSSSTCPRWATYWWPKKNMRSSTRNSHRPTRCNWKRRLQRFESSRQMRTRRLRRHYAGPPIGCQPMLKPRGKADEI